MIYLELLWTFFKIGLFTFGGGYAMLPLIQSETLDKGWMTIEQLIDFIAVSESTPGPFAVNISTYIGSVTGGLFGAFGATFGVVLPSFIIIIVLVKFFTKFSENQLVKGCMNGLKPAVIGLIGSAVVSVGISVFFPNGIDLSTFLSFGFLYSAIIFVIAIVLSNTKLHPVFLILISALCGIVCGYLPQ